ncbi:glycosyltransferase family 4 protein, partial [Escherichia coli]|uniref:glycosyltransferase family 4 protein n=3 Tax=Enterobacteriaceae TaxID=543 RepID=UPI001ABB4CD1
MKSTHSKIKIAHVQLMPLLSGVQRVSLQEFELLPNEQFDINLICKESGPLTDYLDDSVRAFFVPTLCRNISLIKDMKSLISLYKLLKKEKYDIVHTHSSKTGILGRIAARLAGVPCVVHTVHGFAFESTKRKSVKLVYKWLEIFAAKCTTRLICLHNEDKEICIKELYVDPMKISVIPNGVDLEKFAPAINKGDLKEKILGLKRNSFVFTMVGRLWPQKNPLYFAEAAKYIIENNLIPDSVFVIVGDGELMNDLKYNYQTDMNLKKRLLLLGWRNDIPNILKASDVFVLPSLWEGMPLAILEAQSTGLPCIVSNINGNNCLVKNEFDGFLIELNDIDSFINALVRVTDDKVLNIMSKNCRNKIVNEFNIVKRVDKIKDLYIDMVVN